MKDPVRDESPDPAHPESEAAAERALARAAHAHAHEFLSSLGTLNWHARAELARVPVGEDWEDLSATFAQALVTWRRLHALAGHNLWPRMLNRLRRAYTVQIPPLKVGNLRAVRTVTELVLDELGWLVRNLVLVDCADPEPKEGDTYLQFGEIWKLQGRTRALHTLETLSADVLDCSDLAVRLSTEFESAYPPAVPTSGSSPARTPAGESRRHAPRAYRPEAPHGWIYMTDFCDTHKVNPKTAHYHKTKLLPGEYRVEPESNEVLVREEALLTRIRRRGRPEQRSKI